MTTPTETAFLRELDKKLWTAADRLRSSLDAAVYKHAVLGLIFLKYVQDSFEQRHMIERSRTLTALRDTLLLKLMRGEVRVKGAVGLAKWEN